tara:strand:+ start:401 stop:580 length:180 start_codon:yes stop_codon:yes gene_type:complete
MKAEYIVLEKTRFGNYFVKGSFKSVEEARKMKEGLVIVNDVSKTENTYHIFCNVWEENI